MAQIDTPPSRSHANVRLWTRRKNTLGRALRDSFRWWRLPRPHLFPYLNVLNIECSRTVDLHFSDCRTIASEFPASRDYSIPPTSTSAATGDQYCSTAKRTAWMRCHRNDRSQPKTICPLIGRTLRLPTSGMIVSSQANSSYRHKSQTNS